MPEIELKDIADGIKAVQEKVTSLEKQYDGLDLDAMTKASNDAAAGLEAVQQLEQKLKADELVTRLFAIEKAIADGPKTTSGEINPEYKASLYGYLRKGKDISPEAIEAFCEDVAKKTLHHTDDVKIKAYTKDLVEGSNADGGFFITPERSSNIIKRVFETSPVRLVANVVTTSSTSIEMVIDDDEADCGWVGEIEDRPVTPTPKVGLLTIPVHEIYAMPKATQSMLDDVGFDVEGWLQGKVTRKISRTSNTAFVVGNGSKKPRGFLALPAWASAGVYQRGAIEQITTTGTSALLDEADDLITLQNSLHEDYQMGAVFAGTRATFSAIMKLKDTDGQYLLNPNVLKEGDNRILLGKRYIVMADIPTIAASALALVYGNFAEGYTIVDRYGIRVLRDPYTSKPYVKFYTTQRLGGDVTNFEALKILKIKA
jgi:HK97 family phage major capsid protein